MLCPGNISPFFRRFIPSRYVAFARRPCAGRLAQAPRQPGDSTAELRQSISGTEHSCPVPACHSPALSTRPCRRLRPTLPSALTTAVGYGEQPVSSSERKCNQKRAMDPDPFKSYPPGDPRRPPSRILLVLLAVAVAIVVTLFAGLIVYLRDVWTAQPLG